MTRHETLFAIDDELIIVEVLVTGPRGTKIGRFVLDTGSAVTTVVPQPPADAAQCRTVPM